jgi:F-type H+-transporting ATPase subunit delta
MSRISPKTFAEALYSATKGKVGKEFEQLIERAVEILKNKRMLGKSKEILAALQDIIDKDNGTVRVKVTTAKKLEAEKRKKLEHEIKEKYKANMVISEYFEKEELLGGMRVEVGDEVVDSTYKNGLRKLEKFLIQGK